MNQGFLQIKHQYIKYVLDNFMRFYNDKLYAEFVITFIKTAKNTRRYKHLRTITEIMKNNIEQLINEELGL